MSLPTSDSRDSQILPGTAIGWPLIVLVATAVYSAACSGPERTNPGQGAATDTAAAEGREAWTPQLAEELRVMGAVDQRVRADVGTESIADTAYMETMIRADLAHSRRLRDLVRDRGWPRSSEVGREAAHAAFLIVHHTPFEEWQRSMLAHVERAVREGDVDPQDFAVLYDHVQTKLGHSQRYGTQLSIDEGKLYLDPIEDSVAVDSLRADLGMPTLDEYLDIIEEVYGMDVVR